MDVLVLGSNGQLARHLRETLQGAEFWGRRECSLEDPAAVEASILAASPSAIVNAAAYTAVDRAEDEPSRAWCINVDGAAAAARAAAGLGIPMVHVSTDYVFDGESDRPYRDADPTRPVNVYGKTKLASELAVATVCPRHWILRTSWMFSEIGTNFVTTMLRLANERPRLCVVADQRGRPTYAGDLARVIAALLAGADVAPGVHHVSGGEAVSRHAFAEHIVTSAYEKGLLARRVPVEAIATHEHPTRARRPTSTVLEPSHALWCALEPKPDWHLGLEEALSRLARARK